MKIPRNTPVTNSSKRILYVVSLNHSVNDGCTSLISTLFPVVLVAFHFTIFEIGILVASGYFANVIFQPITGHYSERFEPSKLLALGISLMSISMVLFTFSTTFPIMLISVLLLRIGSSFFHPVGVTAISRVYLGSELDSAMGFQSAFGNFGIFIVFLASAPLYFSFGWQMPFLIFAGFDIAVVLITLVTLGGRPPQSGEVSSEPLPKNDEKIRSEEEPKERNLPMFFLVTMFISGGAYAVLINFGNILLKLNGFSVSQANILMSSWIGSAFIGALITGLLTERLSRSKLLLLSYAIASITTITFGFLTRSLLVATFSLILNGFFLSVSYPVVYTELSSFLGVSSRKKGRSYGIIFSIQIIGSSVMGFFAGYASEVFGLWFPFEITSILIFIAFITTLIWFGNRKSATVTAH
jgi:FSR family fosmidomycin resistance protein-like MFS transporter